MTEVRPGKYRKLLILLPLALVVGTVTALFAQPGAFEDVLAQKGPKEKKKKSPVEFTVELVKDAKQEGEAVLRVSAKLPRDHYMYSMKPSEGAETKITIGKAVGWEAVDKEFEADHPPKVIEDDVLERTVEKYFDNVTWSRRYKLKAGAKIDEASISGIVKYQVCDQSTCRPNQKHEFTVKATAAKKKKEEDEKERTTGLDSAARGILLTGQEQSSTTDQFEHLTGRKGTEQKVIGTWSVQVEPRETPPGGEVTLTIRADLKPGWHVYALDQAPSSNGSGPLPVTIALAKLEGLEPLGDGFQSDLPARAEPTTTEDWGNLIERQHSGVVEWSRRFKVSEKMAVGARVAISGKIAWQTCSGSCITTGFAFAGALDVAEDSVEEPRRLAITEKLTGGEPQNIINEYRLVKHAGVTDLEPPPAPVRAVNDAAPAPGLAAGPAKPGIGVPDGLGDSDAVSVRRGIDRSQGLPMFMLTAIGFGFAALLTPCSFPMVPITVSFFHKQAEKEHHRPVTMATIYCLGIIGTFTLLGLLMSAAFGAASLTTLANNPWLNLFIAGVLVFFALNLLGMFEIRIPSWLLTYTATKEGQGGFMGVLFMALTFTLTSFTCTFAFVGTVLVEAANGSRLWPALGLLAFSAAFSLPFFFLALFPSLLQKLPRSGGWMNAVKVIMGLIELGAAFKFLGVADQRLNPVALLFDYELVVSAWMVISITAGMYLLGMFRLPHDMPSEFIGVIRFVTAMSFFGLGCYIGVGLYSAEKPTGTLWANIDAFATPRFKGTTEEFGPALDHGGIKYALDFRKAVAFAERENKPVFIDFTGVNCVNCRKMEKGPLSAPAVTERLKNFVCVQVYTDRVPNIQDENEAERLRQFNIRFQENWFGDSTLPSYAVIPADRTIAADQNGTKLLSATIGYEPDDGKFARFLDEGLSRWKKLQAAAATAKVVGQR